MSGRTLSRELLALLTAYVYVPVTAGETDQEGIPIVLAVARDALHHHVERKHPFDPRECEGCEFTGDALQRIYAIVGALRAKGE